MYTNMTMLKFSQHVNDWGEHGKYTYTNSSSLECHSCIA